MKYGCYVIKDIKAGYLTPMFDQNDATAMRNFQRATMNTQDVLYSHGSDFELYRIGEYDTDTGIIKTEDKKLLFVGKDHYALEDTV